MLVVKRGEAVIAQIRRWLAGACLVATVVAGGSMSAEAAKISFTATGKVDAADDGNPFGLNLGDTLVLTGVYDSMYYDGVGRKTVLFDSTTDNTLSLQLGSFVIDQTFDQDYQRGFPTITFLDGQFAGANFLISKGVNGAPFSFNFNVGGFMGSDDNGDPSVSALFKFHTSASAPEPTSLVLIGSAAVGLWLMHGSRRARNSRA